MILRRSHTVFLAAIAGSALLAIWGWSVAPPSVSVEVSGPQGSNAESILRANAASLPLLDDVESLASGRTDHADAPRLMVLDHDSLLPLAPSTLVVTPEGRDPMQLDGSGPWRLDAELCGRCEVRASAAGHAPVAGTIELTPGENRILMPCAGDLRVVLRDAGGAPVGGAVLALIMPRIDAPPDGEMPMLLKTQAGWTLADARIPPDEGTFASSALDVAARSSKRVTDTSGCAVWSDLRPLPGYRWAVTAPRHVEVSPPNERGRFEEVGGELRVRGSSAPDGVSGRFGITAGLCLELSGTVVSGASVRGRIESSGEPARVVLYRVEESPGIKAKRGLCFGSRHEQRTGADGSFEFGDVQPGTWMLRSWWLEHESDLHFTALAFGLTPGSDLDLGGIPALVGAALEVTIELQDPSGNRVSPLDVYPASEPVPFAQFNISVIPADGDANHLMSGLLPIPLGKSFRVHGLQPGRVYLGAQAGPGLVTDERRVSRVDGAQPAPFDVGSRESIEIALVAHLGQSRPLVLRTPRGESLTAPSVWVHHVETGKVWLADTRTVPEAGDGESCLLTLPDGTYDLWCKLTVSSEGPEGLVGRARASFGAEEAAPVEIALRQGVRISGIVRDADGRAVARRTLAWTCEDWPLGTDAVPLYSATTDERGVFVLAEVPPGTRLFGEEPATDLAPFDAGVHGGLEIVTRQ